MDSKAAARRRDARLLKASASEIQKAADEQHVSVAVLVERVINEYRTRGRAGFDKEVFPGPAREEDALYRSAKPADGRESYFTKETR